MGTSKIEWTEQTCGGCGNLFTPRARTHLFCSARCKSKVMQARPKYKAYNRDRTLWLQSVWYGNGDLFGAIDGKRKGLAFEILAAERILPRLGFVDVIHLAEIAQNAPFDFVVRAEGQKALIDVTTKWQKRVDWKSRFAQVLELPLFILHVSPRDPEFFDLIAVKDGARSVRVSIDVINAMASKFGEPRNVKN